MYENQGREQPLQPESFEAIDGPVSILCTRCQHAEAVSGADQCDPCIELIEAEQDALVARHNAALAA